MPTVTDVLAAIQSVVEIEKAEVMEPADGTVPEVFGEFQKMLGGMELSKLGRYEFYDACCQNQCSFQHRRLLFLVFPQLTQFSAWVAADIFYRIPVLLYLKPWGQGAACRRELSLGLQNRRS